MISSEQLYKYTIVFVDEDGGRHSVDLYEPTESAAVKEALDLIPTLDNNPARIVRIIEH